MKSGIKGITKRWLLNGLGMVVLFLVIIVLIFCFFISNYYYHDMEASLTDYANVASNTFSRYFKDETFDMETALKEYVLNFEHKEEAEVDLVDTDGRVLLTSQGFGDDRDRIPEWEDLQDATEMTTWKGKISSGERVVAVTVKIPTYDGNAYALRFVSSFRLAYQQIQSILVIVLVIVLIVIFFVILSNSYFVSTIINPVKEIGRSARNIALGRYDDRIAKRYNDEIGDLADTINYMAEELSNAEQVQNEFISSVSHELRTPLTSIKGWSETLNYVGLDNEEMIRQGLTTISSESDRLARIVGDLLDFSRMQNGRFSIRPEKMDLLAELEDTIMLYKERAKKLNIDLEYVEFPKSTLVLLADKFRIRQVLVNVVDNAIKYSPEGGSVRVEVADMGNMVQVVVSDTGIGISREDLGHITDRFFRASKSGGIPGSGIGLAVVKEIVDAHHGVLEIESEEGKGTTVLISLPKTQEIDRKDS